MNSCGRTSQTLSLKEGWKVALSVRNANCNTSGFWAPPCHFARFPIPESSMFCAGVWSLQQKKKALDLAWIAALLNLLRVCAETMRARQVTCHLAGKWREPFHPFTTSHRGGFIFVLQVCAECRARRQNMSCIRLTGSWDQIDWQTYCCRWKDFCFAPFKKCVLLLKPWVSASKIPPKMQTLFLSFYFASIRQLLPRPISVFQLDSCEAEFKALSKKLSLALWGFPSFISIITNYFHCFPTVTIRGFNQSVTLYNQLMDHSGVTFGEKVCFCCCIPTGCLRMLLEYLGLIR